MMSGTVPCFSSKFISSCTITKTLLDILIVGLSFKVLKLNTNQIIELYIAILPLNKSTYAHYMNMGACRLINFIPYVEYIVIILLFYYCFTMSSTKGLQQHVLQL